ncbi:hypothetical protein GCK72_025026 [Caenorhabditis remanei]|uniref:F-box domain-containing protein n=1 Tax=Caenorhabditis remanei TaxID=31234 RepID=A0A6A5G204_CAERE|nr:hypothetical protein GCK72_025026 [Caenorhabditis remanei]KAF1748559.1 hypothetical protein GCK72_025026 [Caenorhabditis remanei]
MENQAKAFPILRLPIIVIQEVVSMMNPFEILHFSLMSRIAKLIGQMCWRNSRHIDYRFDVQIRKEPLVAFTTGKRRWVYMITTDSDKSDKNGNREDLENIELLHKYYKNPIEGLKTWFQIVQNTLNATLQCFTINTDDYPAQNKLLIDWIKTQTSTVEQCVFDGSNLADDDVMYCLATMTIKWGLYLHAKLSDQFTYNFPCEFAYFTVQFGEWITVEQLISIPAISISIVYSSFTPLELKGFFQVWRAKLVHQTLQYFEIVIKSRHHLEAIESLPHSEIHNEEPMHLENAFYKATLLGGIEIKRCDGATAVLGLCESRHSEFGLLCFCLCSD